MRAIIYHTNIDRGMYSAQLPDGTFTVFELVDQTELPMYTEVTGDLDRQGDMEIQTMTNRLHVHIERYGLTEMSAFRRTFMKD